MDTGINIFEYLILLKSTQKYFKRYLEMNEPKKGGPRKHYGIHTCASLLCRSFPLAKSVHLR